MKQAEKFGRPIITFIDTPGAYPGKDAEERGQGEAIARNLMEMSGLTVPVIAVVTGEGSSGGALALGVANHILMLENAVYSVLSPEGFASILWKDASRSGEACEMMKLTAQDLYRDGIVEQVIPEPLGGAQRSHAALFEQLDVALRGAPERAVPHERPPAGRPALQKIPPDRRNEERMKWFAADRHRRGHPPGRTVTNEDSEPHGGHQRRVDHQPHRHPHPALVHGRMNLPPRWPFPAGKAGIGAQRPCPGGHCVLHLRHAVCAGRYPQCSLPGAGGAGSARRPACAGRQRGLFRLPLRHGRGAGPAGNTGWAVCTGHRVRSTFPPDGPGRPLHLCAVRRWSRCRQSSGWRTPPLRSRWARAAAMCSTPAGRPAQAPRPSRWMERPSSALPWRHCPTVCTPCWTKRSCTLDDLSWVVCHQANSRIIDHCVQGAAGRPGKVL